MRAVDLFAGAGGFSTGAELAGARVVWAANHWPAAVECHSANHPHVEHVCQDLRQADFSTLPAFDLLLASHDSMNTMSWSVTFKVAGVTSAAAISASDTKNS